MIKSSAAEPEITEDIQNAYGYIAALAGLSERTVRKAFKREPITFQTAAKIRKHTGIPIRCFRCIEDNRGCSKPKARK